jgi:uncharacterized membrane protein
MFSKVTTQETHLRTIVKAAIYRVMSIVTTVIMTLLFGGSIEQAWSMGLIVLIIGSTHYYLYDRLWLYIPWRRSDEGNDSQVRSIVKAVVYRITAMMSIAITARLVFADSNLIAFLVAFGKFILASITYFVIERVFNLIEWGKIKPVEVDSTNT